jgi:uncharacterized protein YecE (DUF72 family)
MCPNSRSRISQSNPTVPVVIRELSGCEKTVEWFFRELEPVRNKVAAYPFQLPLSFSLTARTSREIRHRFLHP